MSLPAKDYLGDGVYVTCDAGGGITLTTEDGISVQNTIYLDDSVCRALQRYAFRVQAAIQGQTREGKAGGEQTS